MPIKKQSSSSLQNAFAKMRGYIYSMEVQCNDYKITLMVSKATCNLDEHEFVRQANRFIGNTIHEIPESLKDARCSLHHNGQDLKYNIPIQAFRAVVMNLPPISMPLSIRSRVEYFTNIHDGTKTKFLENLGYGGILIDVTWQGHVDKEWFLGTLHLLSGHGVSPICSICVGKACTCYQERIETLLSPSAYIVPQDTQEEFNEFLRDLRDHFFYGLTTCVLKRLRREAWANLLQNSAAQVQFGQWTLIDASLPVPNMETFLTMELSEDTPVDMSMYTSTMRRLEFHKPTCDTMRSTAPYNSMAGVMCNLETARFHNNWKSFFKIIDKRMQANNNKKNKKKKNNKKKKKKNTQVHQSPVQPAQQNIDDNIGEKQDDIGDNKQDDDVIAADAANECVVCLYNIANVLFTCAHIICCNECAAELETCPFCRSKIIDRVVVGAAVTPDDDDDDEVDDEHDDLVYLMNMKQKKSCRYLKTPSSSYLQV